MGRIVRMTASEIDKELTQDKIKAMLEKSKKFPIGEDDNPFTPEEWRAKAERPNRGWQTRLREYIENGIAFGLL